MIPAFGRQTLAVGLVAFAISFVSITHTYRARPAGYHDDFYITGHGTGAPAGRDFRWTISDTRTVRSGLMPGLPHSPVFFILNLPFTYISHDAGYRIFTCLLVLSLFGTLFFCFRESKLLSRWESYVAAFLLGAVLYHTYWFQFELERGNCNTVAAFFSAAGLYFLSRGSMAAAIGFLTLAAQWRMYPALLGAILLIRGGVRPALIFGAVNAAALLALGLDNLTNIWVRLKDWSQAWKDFWPSHSLKHHLSMIGRPELLSRLQGAVGAVFSALFLLEARPFSPWWVRTRRGPFTVAEVGLIGMLFGIMALLFVFSSPYKLVIHIVPFLFAITRPHPEREMPPLAYAVGVAILAAMNGWLAAPGYYIKAPAIAVTFIVYASFTAGSIYFRRRALPA